MRNITVSTPVFAKIWSLREIGEETEDAILRRVLYCAETDEPSSPTASVSTNQAPVRGGFTDRHSGVHFPEGFEIFRNYLGTDYRAEANDGRWILLTDSTTHGSLNELSKAIGAKSENAWLNWFFLGSNGERHAVTELRDKSTIQKRRKVMRNLNLDEQETDTPKLEIGSKAPSEIPGDGTWRGDVREGLRQLGGKAPLHKIYDQVEKLRKAAGRTVPRTHDAIIRRTLEDHSSDSDNFRGVDLFCMPEGRGAGVWALRGN